MTDTNALTETEDPSANSEAPDRFEDYALPEPLTRAIGDLGFEFCTPIQGRSLPYSLADYDITGQAQTGTGKTAAFLITLLTRFWKTHTTTTAQGHQALTAAPTRELALQIEGDAEGLAKYMDVQTVCVVGGMDFTSSKNVSKRSRGHSGGHPGAVNRLPRAAPCELEQSRNPGHRRSRPHAGYGFYSRRTSHCLSNSP